ncbi:riboflavin biosynthesis protein RibD [Subtercola boreus]|uniref:Riboflavin biosynthesis protein RibD n=1 Tax=Subtercola boreus TaxID=120213 RepID=A0A3E0W3C5_9MICO|nr:bifunctional diaminohydroxyphosphoribosylaminopyrimidine deaminase/5-amino-6-(5-phosphoribosylamino)uracil reductase RibD [Subtercola boreus]RFA16686.1 riboflavin biosynthesis protein RibD [Subtercola boreus]
MRRAILLSANGPAWGVNPCVGAVLLAPDGTILAEGWHRGAGTPHAEVDALSNLADPRLALGATAVVTLEPCNHTGRTGPCSTALADAGVTAVYFGVRDPGVASAGGAASLASRGVRAVAGLLEDDVEQSIRPWLSAVRTGRPFVTLKWASSLDGRTAAADGTSQWITGLDARHDVHKRRGHVDAIVVGTGTVLADDPELTARSPDGSLLPHQPAPVVIGARAIPAGSALARHPEPLRHYDTHDLPAVLDDLFDNGVRSVFVEGGPTLASAFVRAGLVDEFVVYLAPVLVGGPGLALSDLGVPSLPDARRLVIDSVDTIGADVRIVARPAPPADTPAPPAQLSPPAPPGTPPAPTPPLPAPQKETTRVHRNH